MPINDELFEHSLNFLIANALSNSLTLGLSDGLGARVIHTNSSIPRKLKLSITNTMPAEVQIVGQPGLASPSNYHIHIQFVNNQCFLNSPPLTLTSPNWVMSAAYNGANFITDIYLLSTATISLAPTSLAGSAVHTTEVELLYTEALLTNVTVEVLQVAVTAGQNANVVALINSTPCAIIETETVHLTTFTDAGAPSPLIATLVQPRTILNDGTTRSLLLRLVNTSPDPVTFAPPPVAGSPTPTAIQLSVDLNETAAWALCKSDEARLIVVTPPANWTEDRAGVVGTGRKTWLFRPDYSVTKQIAPNSVLEFSISGVKTSLPPGLTNLYVTLQEFPNYGTQTAVTQIEKSPLIYNSGLGSGLLSSGTTGTNQALTLNGGTTSDLLLVNQSGTGKSAHFKGGAGVSIENNLDVNGDMRIYNHTLWFREGSDKYHGIGFRGNNPFAGEHVNGPVVFGFGAGALGSTAGGEKIALYWNNTGNVGIGTNDPQSTLSVKGGVAVGSTYADTVVAPPNSLLVEGNVGIGTNQPKSTLSVKGGAAVGATYANSVAGPNCLIVEGNVGIGTNNPKHKLEVVGGAIQLDGNRRLIFTDDVVANQLKVQLYSGFGLGIDPGTLYYAAPVHSWRDTANNEWMALNSGKAGGLTVKGTGASSFAGNLGIGTATPTKAALDVRSNVPHSEILIVGGLVWDKGCYPEQRGLVGPRNISIYSDALLWCNSWVIASSDERIKRVQGLSDGAEDLNKLLSIEVTDYSYIDALSNGTDTHKKVIAQQVLKVFPQAVSEATNVVPDIYKQAAIHDGWVQLATNLKKGERVRLIGEKNEGIHEVLEVTDGQFRTDFANEGQQVFVYGREVDDFLNVDYDAIAMLNVSATQQIKREKDAEVQALREENDALRARLDRLENLLERLVSPDAFLSSDDSEENALVKPLI